MPEPKFVVAVGSCACSGGVFNGCYNMLSGIDEAIPVDAYIPGCPVSPDALIDGVTKLLKVLKKKKRKFWKIKGIRMENKHPMVEKSQINIRLMPTQ